MVDPDLGDLYAFDFDDFFLDFERVCIKLDKTEFMSFVDFGCVG